MKLAKKKIQWEKNHKRFNKELKKMEIKMIFKIYFKG